jgi:serine/threonine-protein kinase
LLDFGIAKAVGRIHTTRQGVFKGKTAYMAPEQILGTADKLSDIYAASVMLWEALTAERLFDAENEAAVLHKVLHHEMPAPSTRAPHIPPEIDAIVMRGLSRDAPQRPPTAQAMADALESAAELASPAEVSAWVNRLASGELEARRADVARIERFDARSFGGGSPRALQAYGDSPLEAATVVDRAPPPDDVQPATSTYQRPIEGAVLALPTSAPVPLPRRILWAGLVLLVLLASALALRARTISAGQAPLPIPTHLAPPAPPVMSVAAAASAPPLVSAAPAESAPLAVPAAPIASASAEHRVSPPAAPAPPRRSAPAARRNCSPPYVLDSAGRTHFKAECL